MNDIDFERELKQRLNHEIDTELSARRTPPPFEIPSRAQRIRPWLIPLAAAAAVVAVVGGTAGATHLLSQHDSVAPASPGPVSSHNGVPSSSPTGPASGSSYTSTPASPPSASRSRTTTAVPVTKLGSFDIAVPPGWVVRDWSQYLGRNEFADHEARWCLSPASTLAKPDACPVELTEPGSVGQQLDANYPGGQLSNPEYCGPGKDGGASTTLRRVPLGDRTADHVVFEEDCTDGTVFHQEQYLLPFAPTLILYAAVSSAELSTGMAYTVTNSRAPARSSALPLYLRGTVTAMTATASGHRVTIEASQYPGRGSADDPQPASLTVDIDVPVMGPPLAVGRALAVDTDGTTVTVADVTGT